MSSRRRCISAALASSARRLVSVTTESIKVFSCASVGSCRMSFKSKCSLRIMQSPGLCWLCCGFKCCCHDGTLASSKCVAIGRLYISQWIASAIRAVDYSAPLPCVCAEYRRGICHFFLPCFSSGIEVDSRSGVNELVVFDQIVPPTTNKNRFSHPLEKVATHGDAAGLVVTIATTVPGQPVKPVITPPASIESCN